MARELDRNALDRYITGNYGEDQFKDTGKDDDLDGFPSEEEEPEEPTICGCGAPASGGVCSEPDCVFNSSDPDPLTYAWTGHPTTCSRCHQQIAPETQVVDTPTGVAHADWSYCGARP